jgi:hypothetical protein
VTNARYIIRCEEYGQLCIYGHRPALSHFSHSISYSQRAPTAEEIAQPSNALSWFVLVAYLFASARLYFCWRGVVKRSLSLSR